MESRRLDSLHDVDSSSSFARGRWCRRARRPVVCAAFEDRRSRRRNNYSECCHNHRISLCSRHQYHRTHLSTNADYEDPTRTELNEMNLTARTTCRPLSARLASSTEVPSMIALSPRWTLVTTVTTVPCSCASVYSCLCAKLLAQYLHSVVRAMGETSAAQRSPSIVRPGLPVTPPARRPVGLSSDCLHSSPSSAAVSCS